MKKALLLLAAVLISFGAMAAKIVPTKTAYPNYEGYINVKGSADKLFEKLSSDIDIEQDENISYIVDSQKHMVKVTYKEYADGALIKMIITFITQTDRINYTLKMTISMDGEDITDLMGEMGINEIMDESVVELLNEIAGEL